MENMSKKNKETHTQIKNLKNKSYKKKKRKKVENQLFKKNDNVHSLVNFLFQLGETIFCKSQVKVLRSDILLLCVF